MIKIVFYDEERKGINPEDKFVEIERSQLVAEDIQGILIEDSEVVENSIGFVG